MNRVEETKKEFNVLALVKGAEKFIFVFDDAHKCDVLRQFGRFASNPNLNFTWYDAAVLSQRVREGKYGDSQ